MGFFICNAKNAVERRYVYRMWIAAGLCILGSLTSALTLRHTHWRGLPAYPIASLAALPIIWAIWETGPISMTRKTSSCAMCWFSACWAESAAASV